MTDKIVITAYQSLVRIEDVANCYLFKDTNGKNPGSMQTDTPPQTCVLTDPAEENAQHE